MTDGEGLMDAIRAAPADDTPRLIYADWLQENDQPDRAEFIRIQIEQEQLLAKDQGFAQDHERLRTCACRGCVLRRLELELWDNPRRLIEWFPLPAGVALELGTKRTTAGDLCYCATQVAAVRRGFIDSYSGPADKFFDTVCTGCNGHGAPRKMRGHWERCRRAAECDGRTPGSGSAGKLFEHPITYVHITDKRAQGPLTYNDRNVWALDCRLYSDHQSDREDALPPQVFDFLAGGEVYGKFLTTGKPSMLLYDTPTSARDDLKQACVAVGRHEFLRIRAEEKGA